MVKMKELHSEEEERRSYCHLVINSQWAIPSIFAHNVHAVDLGLSLIVQLTMTGLQPAVPLAGFAGTGEEVQSSLSEENDTKYHGMF